MGVPSGEKGHEVCVLTRNFHRSAIEEELRKLALPNLRFEYVGVPYVPFWMPGPGRLPVLFLLAVECLLPGETTTQRAPLRYRSSRDLYRVPESILPVSAGRPVHFRSGWWR